MKIKNRITQQGLESYNDALKRAFAEIGYDINVRQFPSKHIEISIVDERWPKVVEEIARDWLETEKNYGVVEAYQTSIEFGQLLSKLEMYGYLEIKKTPMKKDIKQSDNKEKNFDRWIKISDRLPKKNSRVLAWVKGSCRICYYQSNGFFDSSHLQNPKFWKPLPEGPKEE